MQKLNWFMKLNRAKNITPNGLQIAEGGALNH